MRSRGRGAGKGCRGSPRGRHRTRLSQKLGRHCLHRAVLGVGAGEQPATPRAVGTGHAETGATEMSGGGGRRPGAEMGRGLGRARTKARGLAVGVSGPCGHGAPRACEQVRVSVRGLRPCAGPYGCGRQPQGTWRGWAFPACKGPRRGPRGHGCDSREQVPGVEAASPTGACRGLGAPALGSEATAGWSPRLVAAQRARAYLLTAGMLLHTCTAFCGALPPASRMVTGSPWGGTAAVGRATWAGPTGLSRRVNRVWPWKSGQQPPQGDCVPVHGAYKSRLFPYKSLTRRKTRCYFKAFNW